MGSWSVNCGISNIAITSGNKCLIIPLKKGGGETREWQPATLPIFGEYNDYVGLEEIVKDDNTKLIEEHFGVTIEEFVTFLVDGKFTYERDEAVEVKKKIKNLKECQEWRFMWVDKQVYDFMIIGLDEYHKGHMDYGTPEMLTHLGFTFVEKSDKLNNRESKRYNQLWKRDDVFVYSDGKTILTKDNHNVWSYGKGDTYSIETYFEVPKELEYLKELQEVEAWRLMSPRDAKNKLGYILCGRYEFSDDDFEERMAKYTGVSQKPKKATLLHKKYYEDLEKFGDKIANLTILSHNLHPMSGQFAPHILYLTPQCGEHEKHQKILEKFTEINKSYCNKYD